MNWGEDSDNLATQQAQESYCSCRAVSRSHAVNAVHIRRYSGAAKLQVLSHPASSASTGHKASGKLAGACDKSDARVVIRLVLARTAVGIQAAGSTSREQGSVRLPTDSAAGRQQFERLMEERRGGEGSVNVWD